MLFARDRAIAEIVGVSDEAIAIMVLPELNTSVPPPTIEGRGRKESTGVCTNERVQFVRIITSVIVQRVLRRSKSQITDSILPTRARWIIIQSKYY